MGGFGCVVVVAAIFGMTVVVWRITFFTAVSPLVMGVIFVGSCCMFFVALVCTTAFIASVVVHAVACDCRTCNNRKS